MEERREKERISTRRNVRYGTTDPPGHISFITDLSARGLCIHSSKVFAPGTRLFLQIESAKGPLRAEGVVVWARKSPPHLVRHVLSGMGVRFTSIDKDALEALGCLGP